MIGQLDPRATLGKTGNAALTFAGDAVAIGRINLGKLHSAFECGGNGPDFELGHSGK